MRKPRHSSDGALRSINRNTSQTLPDAGCVRSRRPPCALLRSAGQGVFAGIRRPVSDTHDLPQVHQALRKAWSAAPSALPFPLREDQRYKTKNEELEKQIAELNEKFSGTEAKSKEYDEQIASFKAKNDELSGLLAEKDKTIKAYELDKQKLNIAAEFNIPSNAINFLQGDSEDALRESAKQLKSVIGVKPPVSVVASGESTVDSKSGDMRSAFKSMLSDLKED